MFKPKGRGKNSREKPENKGEQMFGALEENLFTCKNMNNLAAECQRYKLREGMRDRQGIFLPVSSALAHSAFRSICYLSQIKNLYCIQVV